MRAQPWLPPAAATALGFIASIKWFGAMVPFTCFLSLGWNKKGQKNCKGACSTVLQTQAVSSMMCWICKSTCVRRVHSFHHSGTQEANSATDPEWSASDSTDQSEYLWQDWTLGGLVLIPIYKPRSLFPAIKLFLYVQACFSN